MLGKASIVKGAVDRIRSPDDIMLPPDFTNGTTVYERGGAFTTTRPFGIGVTSCQGARPRMRV